MITREQIHELAQFEDKSACALSFYFQPTAPRNKAHKEEAILAKDLVREALRQLERCNGGKGKHESARADLDRIVRLSQDVRGNGTPAKAVFACSAQGFWREYDLPARLSATELSVDRHFHLKPLAQLLGALPSLGVVLVDRHRARLFDLRLGELSERLDFFHPLTRRGRSDGFMGYDAGHAERRDAIRRLVIAQHHHGDPRESRECEADHRRDAEAIRADGVNRRHARRREQDDACDQHRRTVAEIVHDRGKSGDEHERAGNGRRHADGCTNHDL